jgi:hypothetical protein
MSSLPKTKHPIFDEKLPSTGKPIKYRQMLVREEKILLMAKSSGDNADINRAIKQVVNNCLLDQNIDLLTTFDIEYMFIKIASGSIGNVVDLVFIDKEDEKEYEFQVDLDKVEIKYPEKIESQVKISDDLAISLKYPPASLFDEKLVAEKSEDAYEFLAAKCIDKIFSEEDVYIASDYSTDELIEYVKDLTPKEYNKVKAFIASTPHLYHEINYQNSKGTERKIVLSTLSDFFTLF